MIKLESSIECLPGIGKKRMELFNKIGISSVKDLIEYFPMSYDEIKKPKTIGEAINDKKNYVQLKILGISQNYKLVTAKATDGIENFTIKWFNSPFIKTKIFVGRSYVGCGYVKKGRIKELIQPAMYSIDEYEEMIGKIIPTYSLTKGLTNNIIVGAIKKALDKMTNIPDMLSKELRKEYKLCHYDYSIRQLHFPSDMENLKIAKKRFIFEEFYTFVYKIKKMKEISISDYNDFNIREMIMIDDVEKAVGFSLTNAQKRAITDILNDLKKQRPMSRLLQGDVGSGKTVVAMFTMLNVALNGYQAALMAPTEILAKQHMESMMKLVKALKLDIKIALLTSSVKGKAKNAIYEKLEKGEIDVVIGTHSIIWESVKYNNLAYVVTDEQHRFGVNQRKILANKGNNPHILVMSATPIPRTLAVMLYGDLDISVMDELPRNRIPIKNKVVGREYERAAYNLIKKEVEIGHQAYVVCPLIEESEGIDCVDVSSQYEKLKNFYGDSLKLGLLHGRMKPDEKNTLMEKFSNKEIDVLVSTVVIEVGVDVPNATVMVIIDPQRFGLAQLHQLRGRVGRGDDQSYCVFLILSSDIQGSPRLTILERTNDGFEIANEDLKLRGPGEFFGIRQSGELGFKLADIFTNSDILQDVSKAISKYGDAGLNIEIISKIDTI